jgi:hypothetical protein
VYEVITQGDFMPSILEAEALSLRYVPQEIPQLEHHQIPGVYCRTIHMHANQIITGAVHNHPCISVVTSGTIYICDGAESVYLKAGDTLVSQPGLKRLGFTDTGCTFMTVHQVPTRSGREDIGDLEQYLVSATFEDYRQRCLEIMT